MLNAVALWRVTQIANRWSTPTNNLAGRMQYVEIHISEGGFSNSC